MEKAKQGNLWDQIKHKLEETIPLLHIGGYRMVVWATRLH